jgi:hypothetical protein
VATVFSRRVKARQLAGTGSPSAARWLTGYRRLTLRYERHASHFLAFLTLAATITCYKKLAKCAT